MLHGRFRQSNFPSHSPILTASPPLTHPKMILNSRLFAHPSLPLPLLLRARQLLAFRPSLTAVHPSTLAPSTTAAAPPPGHRHDPHHGPPCPPARPPPLLDLHLHHPVDRDSHPWAAQRFSACPCPGGRWTRPVAPCGPTPVLKKDVVRKGENVRIRQAYRHTEAEYYQTHIPF